MRERLTKALFPPARCSLRWWEFGAVLLLSAAVAFCHLGTSSLLGLPWAEDGNVFLQSQLDRGFWSSLPTAYAGYLHVAPRLVAGAVSLFPVSWYGLALHAGAAVVVGAVAGLAYAALRGQAPGRLPRALVALCVAAVPVGTDVVDSIANLQWFLLFGAAIVLFWQPRRTVAWVAVGLVVFVTTTSSPFGFVVLFAALVRWIIGRGRGALTVFVVSVVGFALQFARILNAQRVLAPGREPGIRPVTQARGYVSRVLGDGVFGTGRFLGGDLNSPTIRWGALVVLAVVLLAAATWRRVRVAGLLFVGVLFALSFVTYLIPVAATAASIDLPFTGGRYYVAPALFALTALVCLVARAGDLLAQRVTARAVGAATVAGLSVVALAYGLATSYDMSEVSRRDTGPSWSDRVAAERRSCQNRPANASVVIQAVPLQPQWVVRFTCGQLR